MENKELLEAMRVQALLNNMPTDEIDKQLKNEDSSTNKKKQTKTKTKTEDKIAANKDIPMIDFYKDLPKHGDINITFKEHDIPYKEQLWGIPDRTVQYEIELVTSPKIAKDISDLMNNKSEEQNKLAEEGKVRYYRIVTYENVLSKLRIIGYVKVYKSKYGMKHKTMLYKSLLESHRVNYDKLNKNIKKVTNNMFMENNI